MKQVNVKCAMASYITIMQALGFALKPFEEDIGNNQGSGNAKQIRLKISCPECRLAAFLVKADTECVGNCSQKDVKEAQFGAVTGTGPQQYVVVDVDTEDPSEQQTPAPQVCPYLSPAVNK